MNHGIHGMFLLAVAALGTSLAAFAADPGITVEARQRYPWNGLVDVHFTITGDAGTKYDTSFTAKDMVGNTNIAMRTIRKADGTAAAAKEQLLPGTYNWVWDAAVDLPKDFKCDRVTVTATAGIAPFPYSVKFNANGGTGTMANESFTYGTAKALTANAFTRTGYTFQGWATSASGNKVYNDKQSVSNLTETSGAVVNLYAVWKSALYMVIDLSSGSSSSSYPVSYLDAVPSGGWTDVYKTTKLVLRRVESSSYTSSNGKTVTLTKPYYIGIFECTQKQYTLIVGSNPSYYKGDGRPVESVSYDLIRGTSKGATWPSSSDVDATSFMGKLRTRTQQSFDLPTRAQWECACLGGESASMVFSRSLSRVNDNKSDGKGGFSGSHTKVGSYTSNLWGIYDMIGNVHEWVLDCDREFTMQGSDPVGPSCYWSDGTLCKMRVVMGEAWHSDDSYPSYNMSALAKSWDWSYATNPYNNYTGTHGFRICLTID